MKILGIEFFQGPVEEAVARAMEGGLVVAPAGPTLADLDRAPAYREAVTKADLAIVDSGFLVLCWRWRTGVKLVRLSGLRLLKEILESPEFQQTTNQLWVMPDSESVERTRDYLRAKGTALDTDHFYTAPFYPPDAIEDQILLAIIRRQRPSLIVINVAGGKQEVLGAWLKRQLDYRPGIICTGAAIAFLTGAQANIPGWADRWFLGWLMRILQSPKRYITRYWRARRLWRLVKQWGEKAPQ